MTNIIAKTIHKELSAGNSVAMIGVTESGKTWYVKNVLMPFLESKKLKVKYFKDCKQKLGIKKNVDVVIVDEVETFVDREYLEKRHPEERPYYIESYIKEVQSWHLKLNSVEKPAIFIITRNEDEEICHLANLNKTEWGTPVKAIVFER